MRLFSRRKSEKTARKRILVVDDDPNIRRILVRVLRKHGYEVIDTDRGSNVLSLCLEYRPRLVFLDLIMPDVDGARVVKILQSSLLGRVPSIVMVSGTSVPQNVADSLGIDEFLAKPFELNRVVSLAKKYSSPPSSTSLS